MMVTSVLVLLPAGTKAVPKDGWIEGTVSDGINPIQNAFVVYILSMAGGGTPLGSTWTDASGHYNLTVTGGLTYMVLLFQGDYYSAAGTASVLPGETSILDIVMTSISPTVADVTLKGWVKDELGNPVTVGNIVGYTNDPSGGTSGPPYYGNATAPDGAGFYTVNVIPGALGGGAAIMDVPGYGFAENATSSPFVSGESYWLNITLAPTVTTDDATIFGNVVDYMTRLPLKNVLVTYESENAWNQGRGYSNYTFTDASGYYSMNVTNGSGRIWFQKTGYSTFMIDPVTINPGDNLRFNAWLLPVVARIRGNVTDASTGLPIQNARVFLVDSSGHNISMATTNASGAYDMGAFAGTNLMLGAEANGYTRNYTVLSIIAGDDIYRDFTLVQLDAWITGKITDAIYGTPVPNASVWVHSSEYSGWGQTNPSGDYNITLVHGSYTVDIDAMNYQHSTSSVVVTAGANIYNFTLMPSYIPDTCRLYGWVTDNSTGLPISNAEIQVGTPPPDSMVRNTTWSDPAGHYEMMVKPLELMYIASARDHVHAQGMFNASGLTELRIDIALDPDLWDPNVTYSETPTTNISTMNPAWTHAVIEEIDPEMIVLLKAIYDHTSGVSAYYYVIEMAADSFNPLGWVSNNLPYWQAGDTYTVDNSWSASVSGGWLADLTDRRYVASWEVNWGPDTYELIRGYYTNSTLGGWMMGTAAFDRWTGAFLWFSFDTSMPNAYPSDSTGMFSPSVSMIQVDETSGMWWWFSDYRLGDWRVVDTTFTLQATVPSGRYISLLSVTDFGEHGWAELTNLTVDNDPPMADAGPPQVVIVNTTVTLDGSGSTDNVGIVNYTWSFDNGTGTEYYYGKVVSFNFTAVGSYIVTLYVEDGAHLSSSDSVQITVIPDQPPVANAGPDQLVMAGEVVVFDGSGSYDDVGIVNWTWTFVYDNATVELWGPNPVFTFMIEGVYDVTLTVRDTAGQTSTDTVQITVSGVIPEFPTLLMPVSGLLLLLAIVSFRRRH